MEEINNAMIGALSEDVFPGAVLIVSVRGKVAFFERYGFANKVSLQKMTKNTVFDLASLTKPIATTLAVIKLVEEGRLELKDKLGEIIPQFKKTEKTNIRIKNLLLHNSGLPDYHPYYLMLSNFKQKERQGVLRDLLVKEPLVSKQGEKTLYSDLGFMVLRWVVEDISGCRLDHFIDEKLYKPLGLENLFFVDLESESKKRKNKIFAATEFCSWRNMLIDGVVHDENAYAMGGIEGHAGLFGTASDVNQLLSHMLFSFHGSSKHSIINQEVIKLFFSRNKGSDRVLGFDTPSLTDSSSGRYFSYNTIGHLGFTGTSFWMDLEKDVIVVLLSNRIHTTRDNMKIKDFRPILHDTIMTNLKGSGFISH
ncbi:MAG: serine hydrolase [Desulfobacterium sp.]|nr:serine hydrolase [Desulfobacterium sp.]MBU3949134.1 serine hydrolase [Pseudomonadota bacterium]MBU4010939.1 serine hydrolase [Pseudomonadota bacterium]MBU4037747.1 serine hydrolase [Pseudomonadota bacterium]